MKKGLVVFWQKRRALSIVLLLILLFIFISSGAKIYLYLNFLLGNDVVVKLEVEHESLALARGEQGTIDFKASVATNPFCSASCFLSVENLAQMLPIYEEYASLRPGLSLEKSVPITIPEKGHGKIPLRVGLQCRGVKSVLCQTSEEPTTRSILVIASYNLSKEEELLKQSLLQELNSDIAVLVKLNNTAAAMRSALRKANETLEVMPLWEEIDAVENQLTINSKRLEELQKIWPTEDYLQISEKKNLISMAETEERIKNAFFSVNTTINSYLSSQEEWLSSGNLLKNASSALVANVSLAAKIKDTILAYNSESVQFLQRTPLSWKQGLAKQRGAQVLSLWNETQGHLQKSSLSLEIDNLIFTDVFCIELGNCMPKQTIADLANLTKFSLVNSCDRLQRLKQYAAEATPQLQQEASLQQYPKTEDFNETVSVMAFNFRQELVNPYSEELSKVITEAPNKKMLFSLLPVSRAIKVKTYPNYNLKPAVLLELLETLPKKCELFAPEATVTIPAMPSIKVEFPEEAGEVPEEQAPLFAEPSAQCCINGACQPCCTDEACQSEPRYYPVVFFHGHSFNKDVSFEYSLDAFNKIQLQLEKEGYLNAGAASLYTKKDTPESEWASFNLPLTIKASYYVDLFQTPENYVVVQAKSENIDVYALRLKEILDTISYRTGRPKVIIVAHSMGGLVARRYMQVFGAQQVAKLITIATPHQGIVGDVADYCEVIGEQRECKDMNAESVFINKLNGGKKLQIPIDVILGTGCEMDGQQGDGVVLEEKARLEGAEHHLISGTCTTFSPLHTEMLNIEAYPEVYEEIKKAVLES